MASAKKNKLELKAFLVLWGAGDSGKTSTLKMLFEELFKNPATQNIPIQIVNFLSSHKDFRIIIRYKNIYIYLSTYGDSQEDTQANIAFFDGELDNNRIYFYLPGTEVKRLDNDINYLQEYTPSFCISASRVDGRIPFPLEYYGDKMRIHTSSIVWLYKEKEKRQHPFASVNQQHAIEIRDFINRKMQNNLI